MTTTDAAGGALAARSPAAPLVRRSVVAAPAAVRALRRELAAGLLADLDAGRGLAVAHALATELDLHSRLGQTTVQAVVPID